MENRLYMRFLQKNNTAVENGLFTELDLDIYIYNIRVNIRFI